ncbi:MAG: hypothetical protein KAJ81_06020, partial [Candidatus Latescibacteria bacterium]|nr:hypothetical protein [Candidatus Latescibacterota bacterium]
PPVFAKGTISEEQINIFMGVLITRLSFLLVTAGNVKVRKWENEKVRKCESGKVRTPWNLTVTPSHLLRGIPY